MVFRFEYYENVLSKHHMNKVDWRQAAKWAFFNRLGSSSWTIASVKMLSDDKVEIVKRHETSKPWFWTWGVDQEGVYERVIIDRAQLSVAVDRMDANYRIDEPFLGQRDFFYVENKDLEAARAGKTTTARTAFVRHNFWLHKLWVPYTKFASNFSAWSYSSAFKKQEI